MPGEDEPKEQRVVAVERALTILEAFNDGAERLALGEIAKRTGYYRSTILRLAASLQRMGYIDRDQDGYFRLGPTLWRLGSLYQRSFHLADYIRPVLADISARTGESAAFYVREGDQRVVLYRANSDQPTRHHLVEGTMFPLDRGGASGRVLTAYSGGNDEISEWVRANGYYYSDGERDPETGAVAVPVFGIAHDLIGALGILGPRHRFAGERPEVMRKILFECAETIRVKLGGR